MCMESYDICFDHTALFQPRHPVGHLGVGFFVPPEIESCVHSFVGCRIKIYSLILSAYVWDGAEDLFYKWFYKDMFQPGQLTEPLEIVSVLSHHRTLQTFNKNLLNESFAPCQSGRTFYDLVTPSKSFQTKYCTSILR